MARRLRRSAGSTSFVGARGLESELYYLCASQPGRDEASKELRKRGVVVREPF